MKPRVHPSLYANLATAAGIIIVICLAAWLRFAGLGDRPMHFDESTGARIMAEHLETGCYRFNPEHFHGPLLGMISSLVVHLRGESSWNELTKANLRLGVALVSFLTVIGALGIGRLGRSEDGLAAAAFTATSPLLVYYGRMFIHEPIFTLFGMLTLLALLGFVRHPTPRRAVILGLGAGLMAATRETFVISLFAWALVAIPWLWHADSDTPWHHRLQHIWKTHGHLLYIPPLLCLALIGILYSDFGRHPMGVIDFFRTYFDYSVMPGHEKPFFYYSELLLWPRVQGGLWWTEAGVLLLALYGYVRTPVGPARVACRFILHGGIMHLLVFSLLAYKTPWLPCLGWLHICLAAGFGAGQLIRDSRSWWRIPAVAVVVLIVAWQSVQSRRAAFRFATDMRTPYAYVPTTRDAERMADWLNDLAGDFPILNSEPVTVAGAAYWPLPWYLRQFDSVGYWETLPADANTRPLILLVSSAEAPHTSALEATHVFFPRGLRHEVLVTIALRKDIWEAVKATD